MEEFTQHIGFPIHKACRNKQFVRDKINAKKEHPLLSLGLMSSFFRN